MWAVLFPGQGSQSIGMGRFYYEQFQQARLLFEQASDELKMDFKKLCFEGPEDILIQTQNTQLAIVLVSCTAWLCLSKELDLSPIKYSAGHSVGEYSALVASQVLSFDKAMKAVQKRGVWMSESNTNGGMSALIGPTAKEAQQFCEWVEEQSSFSPLTVANFNSKEQTVISGSRPALKWAETHYKEFSFSTPTVRLIALKVSGPFHSPLMEPAHQKMKQFLNRFPFHPPQHRVVQNTTAQTSSDPEQIRQQLIKQITSPVLWFQSIEYLRQQGCTYFLELGTGKVLSRITKNISHCFFHFHSLDDIKKLQTFFTQKTT